VSRCGPTNPDCECSDEKKRDSLPAPAVQRAGPDLKEWMRGTPPVFPGMPGIPAAGSQLRFSDRTFMENTQPTVCPRCHRDTPTMPLPPRYVDRDATEPRLVAWAKESEKMLHHGGSVRTLQLDPQATDPLVDDYGVGLTKRITSSHEFEGTDAARAEGAETVRKNWSEIRTPVREGLSSWYQGQLITAVGLTPKYADPVLEPERLRKVLSTKYGGRAPMGRWGAEAVPGQKYGIFDIDDIGLGQIWFHQPGRPLWIYQISQGDFIKHDPFVAAVAEQVYDQTKWILEITPLLLKVAAFGLGFSGSIALVITGIVLDELAEEMKADLEGRPGRSPSEILGSAGVQLLVDRIFHGLFGGFAGKAGAAAGRSATKIEQIAEKAVPAIRRELAAAEKPLVKQAMEAGTARRITDKALISEGYAVEVAIENAGQRHLFRLNSKGTWCRFSTPICGLDLGADVIAATKQPASFTASKLQDTRALLSTVENEMDFLAKTYEQMRKAGRVDVSLLSAQERALLDQLAPTGKAADLSLRQLRDLPVTLGLKQDLRVAAEQERRLVQQLFREGRPLYDIMRAASPSSAVRRLVRAEALGRDAVTGALPRTGALEVDHVVPLNEIVQMKGFDKLRPERQLMIVNDVKNLRAIDALANSSRGDRSWSEWAQAAIHYSPAAIAKMRVLEDELRTYVIGRIAALARP
jgi:hypothetical protein